MRIIAVLLVALPVLCAASAESKRQAFERARADYLAALQEEKIRASGDASLGLKGDEWIRKSPPEFPEWEARAIVGYHQAGASSSESSRHAFLDFYIVRGLGRGGAVYEAPFNVWGNVRVASSPRQISAPVGQLRGALARDLKSIQINELAQGAEFVSGVGARLASFVQTGGRVRLLEAVAFFGGSGSMTMPFSTATLYRQGDRYVAYVPADRERFYLSYGAGFRLSTFERSRRLAPPGTYMVTLGQDQRISGGRFHGAALRMDVFYPLPVSSKDGRWQSIFLFGTVNLRLARGAERVPQFMERICTTAGEAGCTGLKSFADPDVQVVMLGSNRDTYRIGIGVDLVNLLASLF